MTIHTLCALAHETDPAPALRAQVAAAWAGAVHSVGLCLIAGQDHARRPRCGTACSGSMSSLRASYGPPERQRGTERSPWRASTAFSCAGCLVASVAGVCTRIYAKFQLAKHLLCASVAARVPEDYWGTKFGFPKPWADRDTRHTQKYLGRPPSRAVLSSSSSRSPLAPSLCD